MYTAGFKINGKHTYRDFGLLIKSVTRTPPEKKGIYQTVPGMNGFYDFSPIMGAVTYGPRKLRYVFDILEDTAMSMDAKRTEVLNWLSNTANVDIFDDEIQGYHYVGSFDGAETGEDDEIYSELTVNFICQPYKVANTPKIYEISASATQSILNSGKAVELFIKSSATGSRTFTLNGTSHSISFSDTTTYKPTGVYLLPGANTFVNGNRALSVKYTAEVL